MNSDIHADSGDTAASIVFGIPPLEHKLTAEFCRKLWSNDLVRPECCPSGEIRIGVLFEDDYDFFWLRQEEVSAFLKIQSSHEVTLGPFKLGGQLATLEHVFWGVTVKIRPAEGVFLELDGSLLTERALLDLVAKCKDSFGKLLETISKVAGPSIDVLLCTRARVQRISHLLSFPKNASERADPPNLTSPGDESEY